MNANLLSVLRYVIVTFERVYELIYTKSSIAQ